MNVLVSVIGGEHDKLRVLLLGTNGADHIHAAHAGKFEVHQHDIGRVLGPQPERLFACARLRNGHHVRLGINDGGNADSHQRVIVHDKNFHFACLFPESC